MWHKIMGWRLVSPVVLASFAPFYSNFLINKAGTSSYFLEEQPEKKWDANWDKREVEYIATAVKKGSRSVGAVRHILLIRHGQYDISKVDDNQSLTSLGRIQSKLVGERLKALNVPIHCVWTSTMKRSLESSNIIMECIGDRVEHYKTSDLLCEGCPRNPEPKHTMYSPTAATIFQDSARIEAGFRLIFHRIIHKNEDLDSNDDDVDVQYQDEILEPEHYDVVVCHANVIRYFLLRILQLDTSAWLRFALNNCSITWISIFPNGTISVRAVGDFGHIPTDQVTSS